MPHRRTVYFVCTGNTCRSPMAETLFRKALAEAGLGEKFAVSSFGLAARAGEPASDAAQRAVRERGGDLSAHRSRGLGEIAPAKDSVFVAMTARHAQTLRRFFPDVFPMGDFLPQEAFPREIPDPFGGTDAVYRETCAALVSAFPRLIAFLQKLG